MHLLQVPLDGSSPNLKIGIYNKPERNPHLTVSAVQHTSSSAFFPLCDGSYSIKHSVCLPQFIRVRRGHLLSRYVLGTAVLWDLLTQCWKSLFCKVPADQKWKSSTPEAWAILYGHYGHKKIWSLAPKSITARLLWRVPWGLFPWWKMLPNQTWQCHIASYLLSCSCSRKNFSSA